MLHKDDTQHSYSLVIGFAPQGCDSSFPPGSIRHDTSTIGMSSLRSWLTTSRVHSCLSFPRSWKVQRRQNKASGNASARSHRQTLSGRPQIITRRIPGESEVDSSSSSGSTPLPRTGHGSIARGRLPHLHNPLACLPVKARQGLVHEEHPRPPDLTRRTRAPAKGGHQYDNNKGHLLSEVDPLPHCNQGTC